MIEKHKRGLAVLKRKVAPSATSIRDNLRREFFLDFIRARPYRGKRRMRRAEAERGPFAGR
jgi:hypothetical protein